MSPCSIGFSFRGLISCFEGPGKCLLIYILGVIFARSFFLAEKGKNADFSWQKLKLLEIPFLPFPAFYR
jgi:hypothetical protein